MRAQSVYIPGRFPPHLKRPEDEANVKEKRRVKHTQPLQVQRVGYSPYILLSRVLQL